MLNHELPVLKLVLPVDVKFKKFMKKYLGFISGFIFGLLAVFMAATGLATRTGEVLSPFLAPVFLLFRNLGANNFSNFFQVGILLNGLFFGLIGFLIQKYLRIKNKNEYIAIYIFLLAVFLFILAIFFECGIIKTCMA